MSKATIDEAAFERDVHASMSVNKLALAYGLTWHNARKKRNEILGVVSMPAAEATAGEEEGSDSKLFEIRLDVPQAGLEDLLRGFPAEELIEGMLAMEDVDKANLFQIVMQRRVDRLFAEAVSPALEMPHLQLAGAAR